MLQLRNLKTTPMLTRLLTVAVFIFLLPGYTGLEAWEEVQEEGMSLSPKHLRELIVRPVLKDIGLWSPVAEELLMGTAAQESKLGRYLKQLGSGPALGIYQIEPATHRWLWEEFLQRPANDELRVRLKKYTVGWPRPSAEELVWNLALSTATARIKYYSIPEPLPREDEGLQAIARYWKQHYNSPLGDGTPEEFLYNYNEYVN